MITSEVKYCVANVLQMIDWELRWIPSAAQCSYSIEDIVDTFIIQGTVPAGPLYLYEHFLDEYGILFFCIQCNRI